MRRKSWPFGILLLAFALRLIALNTRPMWYDEAFAVLFAEKGFRAMLTGTLTPVAGAASDVHPIVYYTALNGWMQILGQSPLAARLLSVFVGTITAAVAYAIGRRLFNGWTASVGMLIVAASSFQIYYAQETRMYAPLTLFCALAVLFLLKAVSTETTRDKRHSPRFTVDVLHAWLGLALSAALAIYMQNLAAFFLLAFGLSTLPRPKVFAKVVVAGAAAFVLWLPWFLNLPGQFAKLRQAYWVTRPDFVTLLQTALVFHTGEELVGKRLLLPSALFAAIVLPLFLVWQVVTQRREPGGQRAFWLFAVAAGTPALLFLASLYQPVYIQRALLPAGLIYSIALGWLLAEAKMPGFIRILLGGLLTVVSAAGLGAHYTFAQFPRPNFQEAVAYLQENADSSDLVLHSNKLTFFPMYYYDRTVSQKFLPDPLGSGSDTLALPTQKVLGLYAEKDVETAVRGSQRVWFVIFEKELEEYGSDSHPALNWLKQNYLARGAIRIIQFDDLLIYLLAKPAPS